ncbi:MAG: hydroxymethylbilane synthase [Chloroflexota bacterium]
MAEAVADQALLRIGTRGSALARYQATRVQARLEAAYPDIRFEQLLISTQGDRDKKTPLTILGGQGIFVKELQRALIEGEVDCAVHSLKDLPSRTPDELTLIAVAERDDPRDVLISSHYRGFDELPEGGRVGTSSRRRMAQIRRLRPDLETVELRGNIDTRMSKVLEGSEERYDAAVLAAAGVLRMGWGDRIAEYLSVDDFIPAPGQAALGIECRAGDDRAGHLLAGIQDPEVATTTAAERAFLAAIGAGCRSPVGAYATLEADQVTLRAMVADESLKRIEVARVSGGPSQINSLAAELAVEMLAAVES